MYDINNLSLFVPIVRFFSSIIGLDVREINKRIVIGLIINSFSYPQKRKYKPIFLLMREKNPHKYHHQ